MSRQAIVALLLVYALWACEQRPSQDSDASKKASETTPAQTVTKSPTDEEKSKKSGRIWIRGAAQIGVQKSPWGDIKIAAVELAHPEEGKITYGVNISIKEKLIRQTEGNSYIEYSEIEPLLKGIDYVSKVDKTVTALDEFRAVYNANDKLTIATYNYSNKPDKVEVAISTGGNFSGATVFLDLNELQRLKDLVIEARKRLDSINPNTKR